MDDLTYKKSRAQLNVGAVDTHNPLEIEGLIDPASLSLEQLQSKQRSELLEMAQVRYGIKGSKVEVQLTPLNIDMTMTEAQIFKALLVAPEHERADQVLYALAKGGMNAAMANQILAGLALLGKFKGLKLASDLK